MFRHLCLLVVDFLAVSDATAPPSSSSPFVISTGGNSTAPAKDLQGTKPIPTNKGKLFKARASVGGPPGTTDPVLQDTFNGTSTQSLEWQYGDNGRRALDGDAAGWNYEKELAQRRRLTPMLRGNFAGINATGYAPPDTIGAVGLNHYVQMVNMKYAVYNKTTGEAIVTPRKINSLWAGSSANNPELLQCEVQNSGDPTVQYDKWNDRFILQQFTADEGQPYGLCVAVSQTGDPTGFYYLYFFALSNTTFYDFPKMGIWGDTVYFTTNLFIGITKDTFDGVSVLAINKADLLNGTQNPRYLEDFTGNMYSSLLPADVDGYLEPPENAPAVLLGLGPPENAQSVNVWHANVDWSNPQSNFLTGPIEVAVASYVQGCNGTDIDYCVPQGTSSYKLDGLSDILMNRLAYRNFGTHDAMVVTHSVDVDYGQPNHRLGCRWYELRNLAYGSPANQVYQQGTFAPDDGIYRWMGTTAMDSQGGIALGYAISGLSIYAGMAFTGRLRSDSLGIMTQGETVVQEGLGFQTHNRWGDYASMNPDPSDDCTMWFTHEYTAATGTVSWATRIAYFQLPGCITVPTLSATSSHKRGVQLGKKLRYAVTVNNHVADSFEGLGLQITLPAGVIYRASKVLPRIKDTPRWGANKRVGQFSKPLVNVTEGNDGTTVLRWPYVPIPGNSRRKFVVGMKVDKDGPPVTSLVFSSNLYQSGDVAIPFYENYANNVTVAVKKLSGPI